MTGEIAPDALTLIRTSNAQPLTKWFAARAFVVRPNDPRPCAADILDRATGQFSFPAERQRLRLISEALPGSTKENPIGRVACVNGCPGVLLNPDGTADYSVCLKRNPPEIIS